MRSRRGHSASRLPISRRCSLRCSLIITSARRLLPALVLALAACQPAAPKFKSTDITGADYGKSLQLAGHDGKPRTLADFSGKALIITFGFTHCPDVCPTILADLAGTMKKLGPDAERVQVVFVSV